MPPRAAVFIQFFGLLLIVLSVGVVWAWSWAIRRLAEGRPLLPPPRPRRVPWGFGSVLLVFLAFVAIQFQVMQTWMSLTGGRWQGRELSFTELMFLVSVMNAILLVVVPVLLRWTARARLEDLGIRWQDWRHDAGIGAVAFLLIGPLVYLLNGVAMLIWSRSAHPLEKMIQVELSGGTSYLAVLSAVLLAPAAEELIFRGVIQGWLSRLFDPPPVPTAMPADPDGLLEILETAGTPVQEGGRRGWLPRIPGPLREAARRGPASRMMPVILTSALFALLHAEQWPAPLAIFFLSLGLGTVYQRSGSLVASFVIHALFNGFSTFLMFSMLFAGDAVNKNVKPPSGPVPVRSQAEACFERPFVGRSTPAMHNLDSILFSVGATVQD